jgi:hypothetical protein
VSTSPETATLEAGSPGPGEDAMPLPVIATYQGVCLMEPKDPTDPTGTMPLFPIYHPDDLAKFIARIPADSPGKDDPFQDNDDPLLKKPKIDFEKHMALVFLTPDTLTAHQQVRSIHEDATTLWTDTHQPDIPAGENCPAGLGAYTLVVIPFSGDIKHLSGQ